MVNLAEHAVYGWMGAIESVDPCLSDSLHRVDVVTLIEGNNDGSGRGWHDHRRLTECDTVVFVG